MKDIMLLGKKIIIDKSPVLFSYHPSDDWQDFFVAKGGKWSCDGEYLIGEERESKGGILLSREYYNDDVMLTYKGKTFLPATRDLNALCCARWDEGADYLGTSYVCGLNGWYDNKSGIERNEPECESFLYSTTKLYKYTPGKEVEVTFGAVGGHCFLIVDGELVTELIDPNPVIGGYVGFSAYCTKIMMKDIEVRKIYSENFSQSYKPEF